MPAANLTAVKTVCPSDDAHRHADAITGSLGKILTGDSVDGAVEDQRPSLCRLALDEAPVRATRAQRWTVRATSRWSTALGGLSGEAPTEDPQLALTSQA